MVCEACAKNLMQHLLHVKTISEDELGDVAAQMLRGISHVHYIGLVHREAWPKKCEILLVPFFGMGHHQRLWPMYFVLENLDLVSNRSLN